MIHTSTAISRSNRLRGMRAIIKHKAQYPKPKQNTGTQSTSEEAFGRFGMFFVLCFVWFFVRFVFCVLCVCIKKLRFRSFLMVTRMFPRTNLGGCSQPRVSEPMKALQRAMI